MEQRKPYDTPKLEVLGSVQELTSATRPPTTGSAACSDFSTEDALCETPDV